jgi:hypothetical protein
VFDVRCRPGIVDFADLDADAPGNDPGASLGVVIEAEPKAVWRVTPVEGHGLQRYSTSTSLIVGARSFRRTR